MPLDTDWQRFQWRFSSRFQSPHGVAMLTPMKLHSYFRSSTSYRVRIALALKGLSFDYVSVHIGRGSHLRPPFADHSATRTVPLLEVDGQRLEQSLAIIEYLDETHPAPALLPGDAFGRAKVRALAQTIGCEIHPLNNLRVLKHLVNELGLDEDAKTRWYRYWTREGLLAFERQLAQDASSDGSAFCHGDTPTLADCCLVPQIYNAQRFNCDLSDLPRTMAAYEACAVLDAFERAHPSRCPDAEG